MEPFINWVSHILFLRKKRAYRIYLAALKKGAIRNTHSYYVICAALIVETKNVY